MLRTAAAKPPPARPDRPAEGIRRAGDWWSVDDRGVISAGTSTTVASSVSSRRPSKRARTEASTSKTPPIAPSDSQRPPSAGRGCSAGRTGGWRELNSSSRWEAVVAHIDYLRIPFTSGPGAGDVPGGEDRHARELHESSLAPSLWRLSEEMPALPAVRPASPPAAIRPAFSALLEPAASGRSNLSGARNVQRVA